MYNRFLSFAIFVMLFCAQQSLLSQVTYSLDFIGKVGFPTDPGGCNGVNPTGGSDVWGYTAPDSSEYALMGVLGGIVAVKVPEMQVIDSVAGPTANDCYYHRDIKTYQNYAYVVCEMRGPNEGLQIIDLSYLPDSLHLVRTYVRNGGGDVTSHNLSIDIATGFAYILNRSGTAVRIVDLADPVNPVEAGTIFNTIGVHDVFARNDTVYVSEGSSKTFSIFDATNKQSPQLMVRMTIPSGGYSHNIWPSRDGRYVLTTEETLNRTVKVWDIQDMGNIDLKGQYLGANQLAHNVHIEGDLAYLSHYSYGVAVLDFSDPDQPQEVAYYDTYPASNGGVFIGCWGVYPHNANGYVYTSDIEGFLTVLKLNVDSSSVAINDQPGSGLPDRFYLAQNYPNPFNPETRISFRVGEAANVRITVYNTIGQQIAVLFDDFTAPGEHAVVWDGATDAGRQAPSGVYFYRADIAGSKKMSVTRRMMLVR